MTKKTYAGDLTPQQTWDMLSEFPKAQLIDVRTNAEFVYVGISDKETPLLLICRSGVRSLYAAEALTAAGYKECYNIAGGFEGDKNPQGHRGGVNGWKVAGLPWKQG